MEFTLGTAQLIRSYGVANDSGVSVESARDLLNRAVEDFDITAFDTAPEYGDSESLLGQVLEDYSDRDFTVTTKVPSLRNESSGRNLRRIVRESVRRSRDLLRTKVLDHLLLHDPHDLTVYPERLPKILRELQDEGWVREVGVSLYGPESLEQTRDVFEYECLQHPFNLLDRRLLHHLTTSTNARRLNTVQVRSVFLQGLFFLNTGDRPANLPHEIPALGTFHEVIREFDVSPAHALLQFVRDQDWIDQMVIGVDNVNQLRANVRNFRTDIPDVLMDRLRTEEFECTDPGVIDPRNWTS